MPQFDDRLQKNTLTELHHKEEEALVRTLAPKYGYQYIDLHGITIDADALRLISEEEARYAGVVAFAQSNKRISVAIKNPNNPDTKKILEALSAQGFRLDIFMVSARSLEHAWKRYQDARMAVAEKHGVLDIDPEAIEQFSKQIKSHLDIETEIRRSREENHPERVSETISIIFGGALVLNASDIHIEPEKNTTRIRYRIDGVLWDITDIETNIYRLMQSRLKLISGLKLNIHNEAQDGRFTFPVTGREIEVRTSVIPGSYGESIVMRLLDPDASGFDIKKIGLNEKLYAIIQEELERPNGAIVTTGPTGSGKTTALYAFLREVHKPDIKIITLEDPVEYKLEGVVQTQVDDEYTFAIGLRSILRQDPDVILVGEIRDREVAETVVNAALTGHLVFTTLHTNSAVGAFPRLIDLGVDYRMIGSAFNLILAQRLVRKLCDACKTPRDTTAEEQNIIARIMKEPVAQHTIYDATGCETCGASGYIGRIGIFEGIRVDQAVEDAIIRDPRESVILEAAAAQDIPSMQEDGVMKVLSGTTSMDELMRVIDLYAKNITEAPDESTATA